MVRPAAKRSGLGSKQEAAGSNVFGGSDKDVTEQEIPLGYTPVPLISDRNGLFDASARSSSLPRSLRHLRRCCTLPLGTAGYEVLTGARDLARRRSILKRAPQALEASIPGLPLASEGLLQVTRPPGMVPAASAGRVGSWAILGEREQPRTRAAWSVACSTRRSK